MATHGKVAAEQTGPNWACEANGALELTNGHQLAGTTSAARMFYAADGGLEILSLQAFANLARSL
jgi:hypothetical protein